MQAEPTEQKQNKYIAEQDIYCACGYDLYTRGHCGTCGQVFGKCLGCGLQKRFNRCNCKVKTRHPDYPEEWA